MEIGFAPKSLDHLESSGLLAFYPVGVDRVDERHGVAVRHLLCPIERLVEVALDLDDAGSVDQSLGELPQDDVAFGNQHGANYSGARRVGGCGSAGVPGESTDDHLK